MKGKYNGRKHKKNIFVRTRDLYKDYHRICKPANLEEAALSIMENTFLKLKTDAIITSEWYSIK